MPKQELTFEDALKKLEQIVTELEAGELKLDESLKRFEKGMKLSKFCSDKLNETEKRITILQEQNMLGTKEHDE